MRVIVDGPSAREATPRLAHAAAGLALRGHEVAWLGSAAPHGEGLEVLASEAGLGGREVDVVLGGGPPGPLAALGDRIGARAVVCAERATDMGGWTPAERRAWEGSHARVIVEVGETGAARAGIPPPGRERVLAWSPEPPPAEADATHPDLDVLERACEHMLAWHAAAKPRAAVFADRDGTLVVEKGYLADPSDIELLPGVAAALRDLRAHGHPVVVVSNQSGVGRGLFPLGRVYEAMARLRRLLRAEAVELDAVYFCPHRPDGGCACRKPGTALLEQAAGNLRIGLTASVMVGDKRLDAATGQAVGGSGVLVRTGYGRDEEARIGDGEFARAPDRVCDDLGAAAEWFLATRGARGAG